MATEQFVAYTMECAPITCSTVFSYMLHEVFNKKIQNFSLIEE